MFPIKGQRVKVHERATRREEHTGTVTKVRRVGRIEPQWNITVRCDDYYERTFCLESGDWFEDLEE